MHLVLLLEVFFPHTVGIFLRFNHANIFLSPLMLIYHNTQDWVIYKEKKSIFLPFSSMANPSSND